MNREEIEKIIAEKNAEFAKLLAEKEAEFAQKIAEKDAQIALLTKRIASLEALIFGNGRSEKGKKKR